MTWCCGGTSWGEKQPVVNDALTVRQKQELQALFDEYAGTLQSTPG